MGMDTQSIKVELIHWLTELEDRSVLEQVQVFKQLQEGTLSAAHQALLDDRIASYEQNPGQSLDWDEVMKELSK